MIRTNSHNILKDQDEEKVGGITFDYCIVRKIHDKTNRPLANLKTALQDLEWKSGESAEVRIWADDDKGIHVEDGIRNSHNIVLFLSSGFTGQEAIIEQMRLAHKLGKNIIRVKEIFEAYHAPVFQQLVDDCPDDLKGMLGEESTCIDMSHGVSKKEVAAQIKDASVNIIAHKTRRAASKTTSFGGLVYRRGDEVVPIIDAWLVRFAAACGVALPGAGKWTKKWSKAVRIILVTCALMCLSRFGTTVGPAFLDYETIIQISVDHVVLVIFIFVSLRLVNSDDVCDLVDQRISCTPMLKFSKLKQKIATVLAMLLTFSLVIFGWTTYLPGFFHEYYLTNRDGKMVGFGIAHGIMWVVILPIFFGTLFATLLIMFVVQELAYCGMLSSFTNLHGSIAQSSLHTVVTAGKELTITRDDFAKFQQVYLTEWERNQKIQRLGAVPFMIFWFLEFCLMAWSIRSLQRGFNADYEDERVPRLETHWNLVARLAFFMVHSLWFGAGALIVGFLPFGVNFYGFRLRQLCRKLVIKDTSVKEDLIALLRAHDLNFCVWFFRTAPCWLPVYILIVSVNIVGHSADAARVLGAYDP